MNDPRNISMQSSHGDDITRKSSEDHDALWIENTARELAERDILELASLPEKAPEPIIEIGTDGKISFCNAAARREFHGILLKGYEHPALQHLYAMIDRMVVGGESEITREITIGDKCWEQRFLYYEPVQRIRIFSREITRVRRLQNNVRNLANLIKRERADSSRMIEGLGCEMRCELTVLAGYVSLFADMGPDSPDIKSTEILALIHSVIDRLDSQICTFAEGFEALTSLRILPELE